MPQCRHCRTKLSTRYALIEHITKSYCPNFDPEADEQLPLCHQPQYQEALRDGDWPLLLADEALCQSLVQHCCICQQWHALTRSLTAHHKREHGALLTASLELRPLIERHRRQEGRCSLCKTQVQVQHLCPVARASSDTPAPNLVADEERRPKRKSPFDGACTEADLKTHGMRYDACRDSRAGRAQCQHCGQKFGNQMGDFIGLKRHIEWARCPHFDETKPPQDWIMRFQPTLQALFQDAHPESWLRDHELLQRLSKECSLCGRQGETTRGLWTHFQREHFAESHEAMPYMTFLLEHYHQHGEVCLCGSWHNRGQHSCVVGLQLGILRQMMRGTLPKPTLGVLPRVMAQWLADGDCKRLHRHPEYSFLYGNYCALCMTVVGSVGDVWNHLEQFHADRLPEGIAELDSLLAKQPHCCPACQDLPAQVLSQAPKCPFFVNCVLQRQLRHGSSVSYGGDRSGRASGATGSLPSAGAANPTLHGYWSPTGSEETEGQSQWAGIRRDSGNSSAVRSDEPHAIETRRRAELAMLGQQLGLLSRQEEVWCDSANPCSHSEMAHTPQKRGSHSPSESLPHECGTGGDEISHRSAGDQEERGFFMAGCSKESSHHGGHDDSPAPMELWHQAAGEKRRWTTPDGDHSDLGTTDHAVPEGRVDPTLSCSPKHQSDHITGHPLATPSQHQTWNDVPGAPRHAAGQRGLAVHSMPHKTMEPPTILTWPAVAEVFAIGPPRYDLQTTVLSLKCANSSNHCWSNATVLAWMWNSLAAPDFQWNDFGLATDAVSSILSTCCAGGLNLLEAGLNPADWEGTQQNDSSEHAAMILGYYHPPRYHLTWERRIMVGHEPDVLEGGTGPVILCPPAVERIALQDLLDAWMSEQNAVTGFTEINAYCLLQIDRVYNHARGALGKLATAIEIPETVTLPVFVYGTTYELQLFRVTALVYHKGTSQNGHFQAALRTSTTTWMQTDDNRSCRYG